MATKLAKKHSEVYSALAHEYEDRIESLWPVTQQAVDELSKHLPKGTVLDVGCGVGLAVEVLREQGFEASGIDISPPMVKYAQERNKSAEIILADFTAYEFTTKFDGLFAFAFIHLFPKEIAEQVLHKMHSLLKPNGILYIGTTKSSKSSEGYEKKGDYANQSKRYRKQWTKSEFQNSLQRSGFNVIKIVEIIDPYEKTWMDFIAKID